MCSFSGAIWTVDRLRRSAGGQTPALVPSMHLHIFLIWFEKSSKFGEQNRNYSNVVVGKYPYVCKYLNNYINIHKSCLMYLYFLKICIDNDLCYEFTFVEYFNSLFQLIYE